jgi:hypothetical protein
MAKDLRQGTGISVALSTGQGGLNLAGFFFHSRMQFKQRQVFIEKKNQENGNISKCMAQANCFRATSVFGRK